MKSYHQQSFPIVILNNLTEIPSLILLNKQLSKHDLSIISYETFKENFLSILNKVAPVKKKYLRANHSKFITKELRKAIMHRTKLRNIFLRNKTESSRINYNKQRNKCVSILKKAKREYFNNLNMAKITDNKKFWGTVKPLFSGKIKSKNKITLFENNEMVSNEENVAIIFNKYFANIVPSLGINFDPNLISQTDSNIDYIDRCTQKYKNHPSIHAISKALSNCSIFSFKPVNKDRVEKEIKKINTKTAIQSNDIPSKLIKEFEELFSIFIANNFNNCLEESFFPESLKKAEVLPIFKKANKTEKSNYRPISILSNISKIYEKIMFEQLNDHFDKILSKYQCGFRKGHNAQHCLLVMIEKFRKIRDKKGVSAAVLTDLSKAFDCISHDLLIAKMNAYGVDKKSLSFVSAYLNNRQQKTKVGSSFSEYRNISFGVPQGSILGPLLFSIYICDLFLIIKEVDIASYADDTTPYVCKKNFDKAIHDLEKALDELFDWFSNNYFKANASKCHFLLSPFECRNITIKNTNVKSTKSEILLGVKIDSNLNFTEHVTTLCRKANQKLHALTRISKYMSFEKKRSVMKAFITSQFNYCSSI